MPRLLVVDDEPSVRKLLKRYLESRGFDVAIADNGVHGWQTARDMTPDLILSDVAMPEMDGYELVRTIRRNPATAAIPVILLSAHRDAERMVVGYESGADDYVSKPVDMEVLRLKIDALLRRSQATTKQFGPTVGKLICITSAKGGVGTTTLAANLSVLLCRRNETVCTYDLNLEHGDLPVFFDLQPKLTIGELVSEVHALQEGLPLDEYLTRHSSGPKLMAAPSKPHEVAAVTEEVVRGVAGRLRSLHDYVVADLPPTYSDTALSVFEAAQRIVVITSPELTSLRRTRELLTVLSSLGIDDDRVLVVLNRVVEVAGIDERRTEAFLRRPVAVTVPNGGHAFAEAVSTGRPVVLNDGKPSPAIEALNELAAML